jgi:hypothetical protein
MTDYDAKALRRFVIARRNRADPPLRWHLSTLEQQLKNWDNGGNRAVLRQTMEQTLRKIEVLTQLHAG